MNGRLLGIDYGTVRVGLAVSDRDRIIASPIATRARRGVDADAAFFRDFIAKEQIVEIVVGLPVHLNGREGIKATEARQFGAWLARQSAACPWFSPTNASPPLKRKAPCGTPV